jgi:hypothetical protein
MLPDLQKLDGSPVDQFFAQFLAHYLYRYLERSAKILEAILLC